MAKEGNQIIITNNGREEVVVIGLEEYKKYEEFIHFRYVEEKLAEAEERTKDGKWLSHEEFWDKVRSL